jgi:hypothetical protein
MPAPLADLIGLPVLAENVGVLILHRAPVHKIDAAPLRFLPQRF